ncbi:MAG: thermonuclease family protein [bacterium]|nr:thermonuclease family protein [bacterium]
MNRRLLNFILFLVVLTASGLGLILTDKPEIPVDAIGSESSIGNADQFVVLEPNATIVRVVDGDTFIAILDGEDREWTVRMLGIDTPETVDPRKPVQCFGKEASQKLTDLIEGTHVRLEGDPEADEVDKYGRLLRNVFLTDGTDVNALMIQEGYAHELTSFPLNAERKAELRQFERDAREGELGLWNPETCGGGA